MKLFGKQGEDAITKELKQLNYMHTFEPIDANSLAADEKEGIASLMFLTEKRDGTIKAWSCADV